MKPKPIPFSVPMVRALLDGRKTQTRRVLNPQPYPLEGRPGFWNASGVVGGRICISDRHLLDLHHKPKAGDLLWVREPWWTEARFDDLSPAELPRTAPVYRQTDPEPGCAGRYRPARYMCRWMSRVSLVVTNVRVQRVQEISEDDARAEGVFVPEAQYAQQGTRAPVLAYAALWNSIHGPGAWDANPWVAAYTFRPIGANVDAVLADPAAYGLQEAA